VRHSLSPVSPPAARFVPKDLDRGDWPWLLSLLAVGCLTLAALALTASSLVDAQSGVGPSLSRGVPLDDAWIHFQFARNLARGDGFAFNPGHPTAGSTAPLWSLLLAGVHALGGPFPLAGQLLSAVCFLTVLAATYALTRRLTARRLTARRWTAWLAGVVVAVNGRMVWAGLSALETCLFAALTLAAIAAHLSDRQTGRYRLRTTALFGLAALVRPEGYLLFALALADRALPALASSSPVSRLASRASQLLPTAAVFGVLVLPYLVFSLRTAGHLLPNTFSAKATFSFRPDLDFLSIAARYLVLDNPPLLPFVVLGVVALFGRAPLLGAWTAGLPLVYAFLHAVLYQHGRYLMPLIPCNAVAGVVGLLEARKLAQRRGWGWPSSQRLLAGIVVLVILAGSAWRLPTMARQFAWNVENVNEMHVAVGQWVVENTPPDAVLALNDIGAITYVSRREVVDLAGLVTPEVVPMLRAPDRAPQLISFMADREVDYVIIFPDWFPGLARQDDLLTPVHQVTVERRTITGGRTMVVYRADWGAEVQ
jgi:arabinofuranosyltransferase